MIDGPTVDFRTFLSGRGVVANYIGASDNAGFTAAFGLQFDHPAGFAGQAPFPAAAPTAATGWTNVPASNSPAMEMRMRVIDSGTDKYGLNAYLYDSTNNGSTDYDKVLLSPSKNGMEAVATLGAGQWADVKVKIVGGSLDGMTAGFLVNVETLAPDLSKVRLYHTSVARTRAGRGGASRGSPATSPSTSPRSSRPRRRATSRRSRPGSSATRPTSSRGSTGRRCTTR